MELGLVLNINILPGAQILMSDVGFNKKTVSTVGLEFTESVPHNQAKWTSLTGTFAYHDFFEQAIFVNVYFSLPSNCAYV